MSEVISVRIRKKVKEELERDGVDISLAVKSYLDKLAWRAQSKKKLKELHRLIEREVRPSPKGFAARSTRHDRDNFH